MSTLAFHARHYQQLAEPMFAIMRHGVRIDRAKAALKLVHLQARCIAIQDRLADIAGAHTCKECGCNQCDHIKREAPTALTKAGMPKKRQPASTFPCSKCPYCGDFIPLGKPLHGKTDLSSQRVVHFLYATLGFPHQRKRGEENPTGDEVALRKLLLKAQAMADTPMKRPTPATPQWKREPAMAVEALSLLLEHREKAKLATYLDPASIDSDGRLRCMLKVTTENGRLASSRNPMGTGYNLQNIPRPVTDKPHTWLRECFVPDEGCVFLEVDYSQIEDRMVKVLSKDPEAIRQARLRPTVFDAHTEAARRIYAKVLRVPEAQVEVTKDRRQIAKPVRHGANYGEREQKLQESLMKEGVILPLATCTALLDAAREPFVLEYQRETRRRIMRDKRLVNSWGRRLDFTGERLNDDTYRRGYAFRAASENADALNQLGLVPLYTHIVKHGLASRINLQVHDSLVVSCPVNEVYEVARVLVQSMETERVIEGVKLSVPVELKVGSTWKCEHAWKALPSRADLEAAARACLNGRSKQAA